MLVLTRKPQEQIIIQDHIKLTITAIQGNRVQIGIEAPADVKVLRGELVGQLPARKPKRNPNDTVLLLKKKTEMD
jgi:carbon storage regulator CsrA